MTTKLENHLFDETARTFALLDGAAFESLPQSLYETGARAVCLYRGELAADVAEVAPYLVELHPADAFTRRLLGEKPGAHRGIFARSRYSLTDARRHFRKFLTVYDESGNPLLFRFYDPRVLTRFLPTCDREGLDSLFSGIRSFVAESGETDFLQYEMENGKLKITVV
ncbi:MAG: DUF4123 domain-containing protein [Acidobacteria bacterium]|nr:DUF4123 domain-containing protein [Acidobacteriota bacterium]